jgi:predicted transcriptional regulator
MNNLQQSQKLEMSKIAFLPIKPVYANRLMDGTKHFEFRRKPISADVTHIVVYASSPYKRILGLVAVTAIETGSVESVWRKTRLNAGIKKSDYMTYFEGAEVAYAIAIDPAQTICLQKHIAPSEIEEGFVIPQSFRYVPSSFVDRLLNSTGL